MIRQGCALLVACLLVSLFSPAAGAMKTRAASASSSSFAATSLQAGNAVDGNIFNFFSSAAHTGPNYTESLTLDLGQKQYGINRVRIYPREKGFGFPVDFSIQYSDSSSGPWTTAPATSKTAFSNPGFKQVVLDFSSAVDARYIRLNATKLSPDDFGNYYLQVAEMAAEQATTANDQRVTPSSASASSQLSGLESAKLANNLATDFWSSSVHATNGFTESFTLNYAKKFTFTKLVLTPRAGGLSFPVDFKLQYSANGTTFSDIPGHSYTSYPNPGSSVRTFTFAPLKAKALRVIATKLGPDDFGNYYFQLAEAAGYSGSPFTTDAGGDFDQNWNNMWLQFGAVDDGTDAVYKFGNEPTYFEWMARKIMWSNESAYKNDLKTKVRDHAQSSDGFLWSWADNPRWPSGNSLHIANNPLYILAAWRIAVWDDAGFLDAVDSNANYAGGDISNGKTVWQKVQDAMTFLKSASMNGANGLIVINNGESDGTTSPTTGHPTNYWDNLRFGYKDPYTNLYFYAACKAMSELYAMKGNATEAVNYATLAATVKTNFNTTFWDSTKKRYKTTIDINNVSRDFGLAFLNLEALAYGLADTTTKANDIIDWLDGTRTISGDTSTGSDIYYYTVAPRANTLAIESTGSPYWWQDPGGISVTGSASWDQHLENGGFIFYTEFYDILARAAYKGIDNAYARMKTVAGEFAIDELRRDPANSYGAAWRIGVTGEFPESGLVPAAFLYTVAGIDASKDGLTIAPSIPTGMTTATVSTLAYKGRDYTIQVWDDRVEITTPNAGTPTVTYLIGNLAANTTYTIDKLNISAGTTMSRTATSSASGTLTVTEALTNGTKITIWR
ncbi:discoidin domain-containing protein [Cohnella silvisoli]|uniref:Discoidin domain-containing protein n=1 Tax=Cohnella silvisoli TaxID=2873699 RepID=A0ABV1KRE1_9BACL|nr:discoidin domain-containing protein [Cohnella silvisoli]MCD9021648.1 discoidin domain-containing protein [Cohnella silvisoli]